MSLVSFESLRVTTATLIISLQGTVNLDAAFGLLPIARIHLPPPKRHTQKYKIPHCGKPGSIYSLRYKGYVRGIIRSTSSRPFKNSITIDVSTKEKNVSIKLSSTKIQMCGASSVEQGIEGANYIIDAILEIQDQLDHLRANPERALHALTWVKENSRGEPIQKIDPDDPSKKSTVDYKIKELPSPPPEIDAKMAQFLSRQMPDFLYHSDFIAELDWILTLQQITTRPLGIEQVCKAMVNYNYDLGFHIDRYELVRQIDGLNGFYARYHNSVEHNVTIELPYEVPDHHKSMRRKNKNPCHTFLVYASGLVTQSGPGEELMRDAYYLFNETIMSIRDKIMIPNIPRPLKYVKIRRPEIVGRPLEHQFPRFSETGELSPNPNIEGAFNSSSESSLEHSTSSQDSQFSSSQDGHIEQSSSQESPISPIEDSSEVSIYNSDWIKQEITLHA